MAIKKELHNGKKIKERFTEMMKTIKFQNM